MNQVKTIIASNPNFQKEKPSGDFLEIAEFFYDTIQGEGINLGQPAAFLRMQHCTMNCHWCDTTEVWRYGNPYSFEEVFKLMEKSNIIHKLYLGQHLILTGGSPMKQQEQLYNFITAFQNEFEFKPYIEIENECTIPVKSYFADKIDCWNNSPKLSNSGNLDVIRYQPNILKSLSMLPNSWFKFVVKDSADWEEIQINFIDKQLIKKEQVILMPLGDCREELHLNREKVVGIAIEQGVRYCSREHVELWDKKTGV